VGVNVNLAPVVDVAAERASVMRSRAYPGDAAHVASLSRAATVAYRAAHVAATVKHFPGFGRARANTDDRPVTISVGRAALRRRDLVPFRAAIEAGAPMVMASHALYPAFGPRIASQSPALLEGVLRRDLGFRGVVVTDSIEADAVLRRSSVQTAAVRSIAAGADVVLMTGPASYRLIYPRLLAEARRSPAFRRRVAEAAGRVLALKRSLGLRATAQARR
jgi:beta-N-acetylhexosaminidase